MVVDGKIRWREVFNYHGLGYFSNIKMFIILVIQISIYCETLSKKVLDTSKNKNFKHNEAATTMTKNKETYDTRQRQSNIRSHTKRGRFCLIIKFLPHQVMCEPIQWQCQPTHVYKKLKFGLVFKHSYIIQVTGFFFFFFFF